MSPHKDTSSPVGSYPATISSTPTNNQPSLLPNSVYSQPEYDSSFESSSNTSSTNLTMRNSITGVCVPTPTFYKLGKPGYEELDLATLAKHVVELAKAGVSAIVPQGSNGEAVNLMHIERNQITFVIRRALDQAGFTYIPIIVGCGAQSVREAIVLCKDAHANGGDYALVLPPSYYAGLFSPASASIIEFFTAVADASPIPILIYNYPGAVAGLDMNSDVIIQLSKHDNIVGVKLTCGNIGKLNRIVSATRKSRAALNSDAITLQPDFIVLGGSADFALQALVGGGHGILAGLANIAPKACVKLISLYREGKLAEARELQYVIAEADWEVIQSGVVGTKSVLESCRGYGGFARAPLPRPTKEAALRWKTNFAELMAVEDNLP